MGGREESGWRAGWQVLRSRLPGWKVNGPSPLGGKADRACPPTPPLECRVYLRRCGYLRLLGNHFSQGWGKLAGCLQRSLPSPTVRAFGDQGVAAGDALGGEEEVGLRVVLGIVEWSAELTTLSFPPFWF